MQFGFPKIALMACASCLTALPALADVRTGRSKQVWPELEHTQDYERQVGLG
jgi:hypothetical protein